MRRLIALVLMAAVLRAAPLAAGPLEDGEALVLAGRLDEAVAVLTPYAPAGQAEEIRRLWALAQGRQGDLRAAAGHLDRLVTLDPANPRYRVELAVILSRLGQHERARFQFDQARGAGLPADVDRRVAAELAARAERQVWQRSLRFGLLPESNPARRTAAETVVIGGLPFTLAPLSRETPAVGLLLGGTLAALPQVAPNLRLRLGISADAKLYDAAVPDDTLLRAEALALWRTGPDRQLTFGVTASRRFLETLTAPGSPPIPEDQSWSRTWGLRLGQTGRLGPRTGYLVQLDREELRHDRLTGSDGTRWLLGLQLTHVARPGLSFRGLVTVERLDARLAAESGRTVTLTLGGSAPLAAGWWRGWT
ncbi:MAG: tetratricopeptide repeat protein [Rhodobacterales bacterium]|nr:tetratricopeptide repeat protein [Rhodobacterales bacterium]